MKDKEKKVKATEEEGVQLTEEELSSVTGGIAEARPSELK